MFFWQAEAGIRDYKVTGVQTCALPICEWLRFLRQRGRVLASLARPFVWLIFAGAGFAAVFAGRDAIDYRVYMAPGLLGMVVMFGALLAALSTVTDRKSTRLNSSHLVISYAVFCLKKKKQP